MKYVRRDFLKISGVGAAVSSSASAAKMAGSEPARTAGSEQVRVIPQERSYNGSHSGPYLNHVAFPSSKTRISHWRWN